MKNFKIKNRIKYFLFELLCLFRLFVCMPLIVFIVIIYLPTMTILGVRGAGDYSIKLFEKFVFNDSDY